MTTKNDTSATPEAETAAPAAAHAKGPVAKMIEVWAKELKTPAWLFAAVKVHAHWPMQKIVTKDEYEKAVTAAANVQMG